MENQDLERLTNRMVASNKEISDKLVQIDQTTAKALAQHNADTVNVSKIQFKSLRRWSRAYLIIAVLTFIVLATFSVAFFEFAIIVRI